MASLKSQSANFWLPKTGLSKSFNLVIKNEYIYIDRYRYTKKSYLKIGSQKAKRKKKQTISIFLSKHSIFIFTILLRISLNNFLNN